MGKAELSVIEVVDVSLGISSARALQRVLRSRFTVGGELDKFLAPPDEPRLIIQHMLVVAFEQQIAGSEVIEAMQCYSPTLAPASATEMLAMLSARTQLFTVVGPGKPMIALCSSIEGQAAAYINPDGNRMFTTCHPDYGTGWAPGALFVAVGWRPRQIVPGTQPREAIVHAMDGMSIDELRATFEPRD